MLAELKSATTESSLCSLSRGVWECSAHAPGEITHPDQLAGSRAPWLSTNVPGTVAATLAAHDQWDHDHPLELDARDWWYRTTFKAPEKVPGQPCVLNFAGLATLTEVWLNGVPILTANNMFRRWQVEVSEWLQFDNELVIVFRSLSEALKHKRPRPRWKTNLANHQQLRWHRTTLQGRIPGWSGSAKAIGPWRDIHFNSQPIVVLEQHIIPRLEGTTGIVSLEVRGMSTDVMSGGILQVGEFRTALHIESEAAGFFARGELRIENPPLWWPHTHGEPNLLDCSFTLKSETHEALFTSAPLGFRELEIATSDSFAVKVNGESIYCRGACWTVSDLLTLSGSPEQLAHDLKLARDAGANMLRVGGTMVYESDTFYRLCDELGILVWQDFMFANMDYPVEDPAFLANITAEATQQLQRLSSHASVAVYCGNSEIEQQAAMLGMPRGLWRNSWFGEQLPKLVNQLHPGTGYLPSTPCGGVLPFHPNTGVTHYYGVGAYLRPVEDVRRSDVKFTSECLGFSNVPCQKTVEEITGGAAVATHHPRWKRRLPRDTGPGWDFEDVRDHYLKTVFHVDPIDMRSWNTERYLQLSRVISGEMMAAAFCEWRGNHSHNQGGLVWFYKDLIPGAGWGIVDSLGQPKAAYYALKRVWKSRQVVLTDEGLNGLQAHLTNETAVPCAGRLEAVLLKEPNVVVAHKERVLEVAPRSRITLSLDEILEGFYDTTFAYRFGPPHHDLVLVTWRAEDGSIQSEATYFVRRGNPPIVSESGLQATVEHITESNYRVTLRSDVFLHHVECTAPGFLPDDNYFHLIPQQSRTVSFHATNTPSGGFKVDIGALNLGMPLRAVYRPTPTATGT